ncbi:hypothetical protein ANN_12743, partial [Periplaneta americana]
LYPLTLFDCNICLNILFQSDFYRFSISWTRILPEGHINKVNQAGIDYYNSLIDELLANGIQPVVTMFHWDLPQTLQDLGGWPNVVMVDYFEDYARLLFSTFGDRVKLWSTFNEPASFVMGYTMPYGFPPCVGQPGVGDYLAAHTVILSHARVYHMYNEEFRDKQQGTVPIFLKLWHFFLRRSVKMSVCTFVMGIGNGEISRAPMLSLPQH